MPIHVILGKPGSGKSLYATSRLIEELANGTRNIVTNLQIRPDRLNEYLQKQYPDRDCRMLQRLRLLTDDELREFWKYRGPEEDNEGKVGVAYFLDEAHIAFNARDWATLGRGAIHYLSQHRKLGDVVWPITQSPGNLDKQFRSVSEDFTVLRNEYTAKYGPFKGRGRFVRRTYLSEPGGNAEPFEKATFTLDKDGIASCYDTAKGIGVHGSKADIGRRAKGWSIWWAFGGALFLAALVGLVPFLLGKAAQSAMTKGVKETEKLASAFDVTDSVDAGVDQAAPAFIEPISSASAPEDPVFSTGYVARNGRINIQLNDGRVITEKDKELTRVERNSVYWNDKRIWIMPRPLSEREIEKRDADDEQKRERERMIFEASLRPSPPDPAETALDTRQSSRVGQSMQPGTFSPSDALRNTYRPPTPPGVARMTLDEVKRR
jgi:hypothetical protein